MKIIVNPHTILLDKTPVNELELNVTKCKFEFAEEITNDFVKEAYFTLDNGNTYKKIIVNNECDIPGEVLEKKGGIELGVVAYLVENETEIKRYNPSPAYFDTWLGSLRDAENSEPITPSEMEQYEQALQDGLAEVNDKLDEIDQALDDVTTAIEETNNLDLDVSKEGKTATVTLTKKDATTKTVTLSDGTSLMFNWDGTRLGIKTDEDADYTYVDLQGIQGPIGPKGEAFTIKKTYSSVAEMNADFNNMQLGDYVMIASTVEVEDNAKLYTRGESQWIFISDFSGATGIKGETGATPNIQIGTVTSGTTPSVTRSGTNENPVLNFVLVKGDTGNTGPQGETGATGNGIASIIKTGTSGLVDTYTITYTDGTTSTFEVTNGQDGEVTQEELDETNAEVERAKMVYNALPKVTGTGTEVTLNDTAICPMPMSLRPSTTSQDTTTGKNLFDKNNSTILNAYVSTEAISGQDNTSRLVIIPVKPDTTYTISKSNRGFDGSHQWMERIAEFSSVPTYSTPFIVKYNNVGMSYTFTTSSTTNYIAYGVAYGATYISNLQDYIDTIQLEIGSTATDYEPYTGGIASPNPSYPQDIHTVSGNNTIKITGKNLFDKNTAPILQLGISSTSKAISTNTNRRLTYISCEPNTTYKVSKIYDSNNNNFIVATATSIPANGNTATNVIDDASASNITITSGSNDTYLIVQFYRTDETLTMQEVLDTIKIIKDFALFPINLGDIELCKIDTYEDYFYKDNGKWYLHKEIEKVVLNGTESYTYDSTYTRFYIQLSFSYNTSVRSQFPCNLYTNGDSTTSGHFGTNAGGKLLYFFTPNSNITTTTDFKNWVSSNNLIIYVVLATPTNTEITDTTLISQLEAIYNWAISYQDQTNITQVNNDLPFVITATGIRDLSNIFDLISGTEL